MAKIIKLIRNILFRKKIKYFLVSYWFERKNEMGSMPGNIIIVATDFHLHAFQERIKKDLNVGNVIIMSFCEVKKDGFDRDEKSLLWNIQRMFK